MKHKPLGLTALLAAVFLSGYLAGTSADAPLVPAAEAAAADRVFELRTYTTHEGKLGDLNTRFRNHTMRIFQRHGMTNVGYWIPQDSARSKNTLIYILAHPSREAAAKSWADFRADPEWQKVSRESEANGKIVSKVESVFMDPTDYSPVK